MSAASTTPQTSPTPILDRLTPVPAVIQPTPPAKARLNKLIYVLLGFALVEVLWFAAKNGNFADMVRDAEPFLVLFGTALLAGFSVIVVHELGHLIAGWSVGFRFVSIRFGPIQISSPLHISWYRDDGTGAAGLTRMLPTSTTRLRLRKLIFTLAGPAANLLSAYAVVRLFPASSIFTGWFGLLSILMGIGNLVPFRHRGTISDGRRILLLRHRDNRDERSMAILQLADDLKKGVAPRDLRPNMVALAIAVRDDSPQTALAHLFAYWHAYYAGSEAEAASLLETSLQYSSSLPPVLHESLLCEAGIFQASKRKRTDLARAWLADLPKKSKHLVRLEGAILETEEDFPGALGKIDEVVAETLNRPDRPSRATSLRLLREWRSEVLEKANAQLVSPAQ